MADLPPQMEVNDSRGSTVPYSGTVGTTAVNVPSAAGSNITELMVRCPFQSPNTKQLLYSLDGGATYLSLDVGESLTWPLKGSLKQIQIKGSTAGVSYEVILNTDQAGEP